VEARVGPFEGFEGSVGLVVVDVLTGLSVALAEHLVSAGERDGEEAAFEGLRSHGVLPVGRL
jgi:hypothetical protein